MNNPLPVSIPESKNGGSKSHMSYYSYVSNPLNAELNPICHLLALLGAHHILHISRIKVNLFLCRPGQASRRLRLPDVLESWNLNVVWLSALRSSRLHPPGYISGTHFCHRLSRTQGHSVAGRIKSIKNPNYPPSACSAVLQPNVPPR
jgi:hypothetical protein